MGHDVTYYCVPTVSSYPRFYPKVLFHLEEATDLIKSTSHVMMPLKLKFLMSFCINYFYILCLRGGITQLMRVNPTKQSTPYYYYFVTNETQRVTIRPIILFYC